MVFARRLALALYGSEPMRAIQCMEQYIKTRAKPTAHSILSTWYKERKELAKALEVEQRGVEEGDADCIIPFVKSVCFLVCLLLRFLLMFFVCDCVATVVRDCCS